MKKSKNSIYKPLVHLFLAGFGLVFVLQFIFYLLVGPNTQLRQHYLFLDWCGSSLGSSSRPRVPYLFCEGDPFPMLNAFFREVVYFGVLLAAMVVVIVLIIAPLFVYFVTFIKTKSRIISWILTLLLILTELVVIYILDYYWNVF